MPIPIDQRKKPTAVKIHVKTGTGVDITWADGHSSHFDFAYLREQCPCATCNDERGKKDVLTTMNLPSSPLLPICSSNSLNRLGPPENPYRITRGPTSVVTMRSTSPLETR